MRDARTTRSDGVADSGTVDLGYHAPAIPLKYVFLPVVLKAP